LLPEPYTSLEEQDLPAQQVWFIILTSTFLLLFIGLLVHWQSGPLKRLARSARDMSLGADVEPVLEGGGSEVVEVTRAFNTMRARISRYLSERGQLFSAISHDLRTPITRLRLRVELLEDEVTQAKFTRDLDELELLVKGALQCVKDTDIHENIEPVDLNHALDCLIEPYLSPEGDGRVTLQGKAMSMFPGKPLALRRCMGNLIDNAIKYGDKAHLHVEDDAEAFILHVDDEGPGVPEQRLEQVFEPHFRLAGNQQQGYGLGLGIARNIAHSHGGEVTLQNLRDGGLRVTLFLPRGLE
jgi:signal transduction histidine kinase